MFQCNLFEKTIFSDYLKKIYFHILFQERSSFMFHLKKKMIFSGKRNIIFPDNKRKIILHQYVLEKTIFSEHLGKEYIAFCAVYDLFPSEKLN